MVKSNKKMVTTISVDTMKTVESSFESALDTEGDSKYGKKHKKKGFKLGIPVKGMYVRLGGKKSNNGSDTTSGLTSGTTGTGSKSEFISEALSSEAMSGSGKKKKKKPKKKMNFLGVGKKKKKKNTLESTIEETDYEIEIDDSGIRSVAYSTDLSANMSNRGADLQLTEHRPVRINGSMPSNKSHLSSNRSHIPSHRSHLADDRDSSRGPHLVQPSASNRSHAAEDLSMTDRLLRSSSFSSMRKPTQSTRRNQLSHNDRLNFSPNDHLSPAVLGSNAAYRKRRSSTSSVRGAGHHVPRKVEELQLNQSGSHRSRRYSRVISKSSRTLREKNRSLGEKTDDPSRSNGAKPCCAYLKMLQQQLRSIDSRIDRVLDLHKATAQDNGSIEI